MQVVGSADGASSRTPVKKCLKFGLYIWYYRDVRGEPNVVVLSLIPV